MPPGPSYGGGPRSPGAYSPGGPPRGRFANEPHARVSNVVFNVDFESFSTRDAGSSARALAGAAVRHLPRG